MGTNKILIAGLVGGIASFFTGFLIWGVALAGMPESQGVTNIMKESPDYWAVVLGSLASGMMIAVIYGQWAHIKTWKTGASRGAIIGLLLGINYAFLFLGTTSLSTVPMAIVDSIAYAVLYAVIGAVVGLMLGRGVPALEEATA